MHGLILLLQTIFLFLLEEDNEDANDMESEDD